MILKLKETEDNILAKLAELCDDYNFARYSHPGSLNTLGRPINSVTALLRFSSIYNPRPNNLNSRCINLIPEVKFEIHTVHVDYRTHACIYDLACAISQKVRGRRDLLVFKDGVNNTQMTSFIENFRFMEVDGKDFACYSYSFDLVIPYAETYSTQRL